MTRGAPALELEVRPPWPYRLPERDARDGTMRVRGGVVHRLLSVDGRPVLARAWEQSRDGRIAFRAEPAAAIYPVAGSSRLLPCAPAGRAELQIAIERMRFALGVDDDLSAFYRSFKSDRLLGPLIRGRPWVRPRRRPWPWEALAWAITEQLIESERAASIQRRIVGRFGPRLGPRGRVGLADVPDVTVFAGMSPAELAGMDLAEARALALVRAAREVAAGRAPLDRPPAAEKRLLSIPSIGPWTVEMLALKGQGAYDRLPAGDLAYLKLVGSLAGLGRRASVEEVQEYFAPYAPFRGLAGVFFLIGHRSLSAAA